MADPSKVCRGRQTANTLESSRRCERAESECEDSLEKEQGSTLPSTGRFEDRFSHCLAQFDRLCIGPAHTGQVSTAAGCTSQILLDTSLPAVTGQGTLLRDANFYAG